MKKLHHKKKRRWKKPRRRKYLLPKDKCVALNEKFEGSNAHHLSYNIIMYIPIELHQHIKHSLKSGIGMTEMNLLAMQYLYGEI